MLRRHQRTEIGGLSPQTEPGPFQTPAGYISIAAANYDIVNERRRNAECDLPVLTCPIRSRPAKSATIVNRHPQGGAPYNQPGFDRPELIRT